MKSPRQVLFTTLLAFLLAIFSRQLIFAVPSYRTLYDALPEILQWLEQPLRWNAICVLGLYVATRVTPDRAIAELGLNGSVAQGMGFGLLATLPMLIVPLFSGQFAPNALELRLLFLAGVWPIAEEILFRGYAFGQMHRHGGLGLWPAALLTGFVFGVAHLGQASVQQLPLGGEVGTVLMISIGGLLFAWLYVKWDYNLWVPFGLHCFMNLWWAMFDLADSPLGGWLPNVLRAAVVLLAILMTLYRARIPFLQTGAVRT